jgi:hypothetical protein
MRLAIPPVPRRRDGEAEHLGGRQVRLRRECDGESECGFAEHVFLPVAKQPASAKLAAGTRYPNSRKTGLPSISRIAPQPVEYRGRRQSGADGAWVPSEASTD